MYITLLVILNSVAITTALIHDPATAKEILWQRGELPPQQPLFYSTNLRLGRIDDNGDFVPTRNNILRSPINHVAPGPLYTILNWYPGGPYTAYELRSNALIPGYKDTVKFVPEIGAVIIKSDRNRSSNPYYFENYTNERNSNLKIPQAKIQNMAKAPKGWRLLSFEQAAPTTFSVSGNPWHVRVIADVAEYGHLDPDGEFIPDYGLPVMPRSAVPEPAVSTLFDDRKWHFAYTLPRNGAKTELVYEYRSGRLIKGTLHDTGNFAPEIGSTILDFKEYDPESTRRIYNLPGVLRKIKK